MDWKISWIEIPVLIQTKSLTDLSGFACQFRNSLQIRRIKTNLSKRKESVQEVVLEFLATHISPCLLPSLQRMKQKIQQQKDLENRVEESASRGYAFCTAWALNPHISKSTPFHPNFIDVDMTDLLVTFLWYKLSFS
ncbi:hypothetical protein CDAR_166221 [Caerostris darwini]|uniref:Uncharacterized protein n=1 Tax=Caerostris darwini TaxID=1538125 RepID=A0AAV4RVK8_9ARAC|nr:hypothetical protein CDAR_166221 [Caerostris darwini]